MAQSTRRVFAFLLGIDLTHYSRERVSKATKLSPRTVDYALAKLVEMSAIERRRGGRSTPAKVRLLMTMEEFLAHQAKIAHQVPKVARYVGENCAPSGALRALEVILEPEQQQRKPPGVEIPKETIRNEFGRVEINPAYLRWRDREQRIRRANNPAAYRAALERRHA